MLATTVLLIQKAIGTLTKKDLSKMANKLTENYSFKVSRNNTSS